MTDRHSAAQGAVDRVAGECCSAAAPACPSSRTTPSRPSRASRRSRSTSSRSTRRRSGCATSCSSTWTWRASRRPPRPMHLRPGDRPAAAVAPGAGARPARDRGYFDADVKIAQTVGGLRPAASQAHGRARAAGAGCRASRSTGRPRWRHARRLATSPGPTGWKSCAGTLAAQARPALPPRRLERSQERDPRRGARRRLSDGGLAVEPALASMPPNARRRWRRRWPPARCSTSARCGSRHPPLRRDRGPQPGDLSPGDVYNEKLLLDYQERLTKIGLFEGGVGRARRDRPARGGARWSSR
jgi:hypothetical protein